MNFSISNQALVAITLPIAALGCRSTQSNGQAANPAFVSPDAAFGALASAARGGSKEAVGSVLGSLDLLEVEDEATFHESVTEFLDLYDSAHHVETPDSTHAVLFVGESDWPFPIPLVESGGAWSFDVEAGHEEIMARQIGENELAAIQVCRAIGDAQEEYRAEFSEYATRIVSSDEAHDGLYWVSTESGSKSPVGVLVAEAAIEGTHTPADGDCSPYMGYYFRMLEVPGDGEAKGYAVLAWPAEYGSSGVMSFSMDDRGVVLETDFGEQTEDTCCSTRRFEPTEQWGVCAD